MTVPVGRRAVLMQLQRVDIGEVSRTGCRLDGSRPLDIGSVGMLAAEIDGQVHLEYFRVSRTATHTDGETRYEAGVEFLPVPADTPSLHDLAAYFEESHS